MKKKFVKTTLTLSLLLMATAPTYAFADTNCGGNVSVPLNQQVVVKDLNSLLSSNLKNCLNLESLTKQLDAAKVNAVQGKNCQKIAIQNLANQKGATATPSKATATPSKVTTTPSKSASQNANQASNQTGKNNTTANTATNTTTNTTANTAAVGSYEQQVANIVNKERAAAGLAPLTLSTELSKVAEAKAQDMSDNNYFSHTSPTYGSPFDMMKQFGIQYSSAGENIAMGQQTPESVMTAWMNSSGHKANILGASYGKIGVGYVKNSNGTTYWVQEFTN